MAVPGAGVGSVTSRIDAALGVLALPLAAAFALGGQYVIALNRGLYRSLLPGAALLGLAILLLMLALERRRRAAGDPDGRSWSPSSCSAASTCGCTASISSPGG